MLVTRKKLLNLTVRKGRTAQNAEGDLNQIFDRALQPLHGMSLANSELMKCCINTFLCSIAGSFIVPRATARLGCLHDDKFPIFQGIPSQAQR
jgi:hypothetical protein